MAIYFGNDKIKDIYVSSDIIKEVYYGSEKVWDNGRGYWVQWGTGVKTYFGLDDPSIVDGIMSPPTWATNCIEVKIPDGVTGLGDNCFSDCTSLTSITLPESVVSLGDYCFSNCTYLTSITLPESVVSLGDFCFHNCLSLTAINIPEGVTSLGEYCFYKCKVISSITIPEGVTSLEYGCFAECYALTSISIPESVTSLGDFCFSACVALTSITIPEGVTSIGAHCFYNCSSLTLATVLPAIPPTLGVQAFDNVHTSLVIRVHSPYRNVTNWSAYASKISLIEETANDGYWVHKDTGVKTYFWLENLTIVNGAMSAPSWNADCSEVKIPSGVTGLAVSCFYYCPSLTSITLPESLTSLGSHCFNGCTALTSITIPENVTSLGSFTFYNCSSFTLAIVLPAIPPTITATTFINTHTSFNIKVRSPYVNDYKTATNWINYADKISAI